jgi:RNA polymerase sigma-32 factor
MSTYTARAFGPLLARTEQPCLEPARERELVLAAQGGDRAAQEQLVGAHLRLVRAVARRVTRNPSEDVLAEGLVGLLEAIPRFDTARDCRFSTYASYWIRARVQQYVLATRQIVGAPGTRASRRVFAQLGRARRALGARISDPDASELAREIGVDVADVEGVLVSLRGRDTPIDTADHVGSALAATVEDDPEERVACAEQAAQRRRVIGDALATLPSRERRVIELRTLSDEGATLGVLAEALDLSRERVRQLEARALRHIGDALVAEGLAA